MTNYFGGQVLDLLVTFGEIFLWQTTRCYFAWVNFHFFERKEEDLEMSNVWNVKNLDQVVFPDQLLITFGLDKSADLPDRPGFEVLPRHRLELADIQIQVDADSIFRVGETECFRDWNRRRHRCDEISVLVEA